MHPYPQMPPLTRSELRTFLTEAPIARLGTTNEDGTIHIVPCLYRTEGADILLGTQLASHKVRNIERDARVTLLIDNEEPPYRGVMLYGVATLERDGSVARRTWIFERSMPAEQAAMLARGLAACYEPVLIRVRPTRVTSWDYTKEGFIQRALLHRG